LLNRLHSSSGTTYSLVRILLLYDALFSHSARRHRQTDVWTDMQTDRQTGKNIMSTAYHIACIMMG